MKNLTKEEMKTIVGGNTHMWRCWCDVEEEEEEMCEVSWVSSNYDELLDMALKACNNGAICDRL